MQFWLHTEKFSYKISLTKNCKGQIEQDDLWKTLISGQDDPTNIEIDEKSNDIFNTTFYSTAKSYVTIHGGDKGQKISEAIFLACKSSKKPTKKLS